MMNADYRLLDMSRRRLSHTLKPPSAVWWVKGQRDQRGRRSQKNWRAEHAGAVEPWLE